MTVSILARRTESAFVPTDETGPVRHGMPRVGDFVLVKNAGGRHSGPGRYGYTRTEVTGVAVRTERGAMTTHRIETAAFGWGCWGEPHDRMIVC